ncbi:MAG: hypothetical protein JXM70_04040 [Pirellulales bacterium]|nr:hypothetical protein [Pirellulales bacterium]
MHVVDVLEDSLRLAKQIGYRIRQEWLGGSGGGGCEIRGQKCLFLDLSLGPDEQLDQVLDTLKHDPALAEIEIPPKLRPLFPDVLVSSKPSPNPSLATSESTSSSPGTAAAALRPFTKLEPDDRRRSA